MRRTTRAVTVQFAALGALALSVPAAGEAPGPPTEPTQSPESVQSNASARGRIIIADERIEGPAPGENGGLTAEAPLAAEPSIKARLVVSQFVDAPVAGDADNTLRYSGRADAYVQVGGSLFGLDDSWRF